MPGGNEVKSVNENLINKTLSFENYTNEEFGKIVQQINDYTNYSENNPILGDKYTKQQMEEMKNVLKANVFSSAPTNREEIMPFINCALLAKGYSIEDIVGNRVEKSEFDNIYSNVMDLKDPAKKDKAMDWVYTSFVKGMHVAASELDKRIDDMKLKSADTWMKLSNWQVTNTFFVGASNFFQEHENDNFRDNVKKAIDKEGLKLKDETFDIENTLTELNPKISKFNPNSFIFFAKNLSNANTKTGDLLKKTLSFYALSNSKPQVFSDVFNSTSDVANGFEDEEVRTWFNGLSNKPGASDFIYDCIKTGKFFSSISIKGFDEDKGGYTYNINADVKELEEAYMDFSKNLDTNILKRDFSEAITNDRKANSVTYEEVEETRRLSNNYSKASGILDDIAATRARNIYELSSSYNSLKNPTQKDLDRLTNLTRVISPIVEEAQDKRGVSVRSMATELSEDDFVFGSEKGEDEKPLSETQMWEYKTKCKDLLRFNLVKNSLDIKDDYDIESRINEELGSFKKTHEGAEKLSKSELMDSFVSKQKEAVVELSQSKTFSRVYHTPESPNTNKVITDKFKDFMEQLEATSQKDENGMMKGNTELFNKMYESVKAVAVYEGNGRALPKGEGLDALLNKAKENIDNYVKERDSFIKFTKKGRDRIDIAKNMQKVTDIYNNEYGNLCEELIANHEKNVKGAVCKAPEIKEMMAAKPVKTVQKEKTSEKTKSLKEPEKQGLSKNGF